MISISSNIDGVRKRLSKMAGAISDPDKMLREMATTVAGMVRARVHVDGEDSSLNPIGTYTDGYMKLRTGKGYKNEKIVTKGQFKYMDRNTYRKQILGIPDRTSDTAVVLSLTRSMENELLLCKEDPIKLENGYGIGYRTDLNYEKSQWVEETYQKEIWKTSGNERQVVKGIAEQHIERSKNV